MDNTIFKGAFTALITPFKNHSIDFDSLKNLLEFQIENNINGLVISGSTGEGTALSSKEKLSLIDYACTAVKGRVPIIAGISSNNTEEAQHLAQEITKLGVNAIMLVLPYYNKPTPAGIVAHFQEVAKATTLPIIAYNVPTRTGIDWTLDTLQNIANVKGVIGIKDASGVLSRPLEVRARLGADFIQLCGDDINALAFNAQGGCGVISVASNIIPLECTQIQTLCASNKYQEALDLHIHYTDLYNVLFCESNPTPVKYALSVLGLCKEDVRLPLVPPTMEHKKKITSIMRALKVKADHEKAVCAE